MRFIPSPQSSFCKPLSASRLTTVSSIPNSVEQMEFAIPRMTPVSDEAPLLISKNGRRQILNQSTDNHFQGNYVRSWTTWTCHVCNMGPQRLEIEMPLVDAGDANRPFIQSTVHARAPLGGRPLSRDFICLRCSCHWSRQLLVDFLSSSWQWLMKTPKNSS